MKKENVSKLNDFRQLYGIAQQQQQQQQQQQKTTLFQLVKL